MRPVVPAVLALVALGASVPAPAAADACGLALAPVDASPPPVTKNGQPLVRVEFASVRSSCGLAGFEMRFDGAPVPATAETTAAGFAIAYHPPAHVGIGPHRVAVDATDGAGATGAWRYAFVLI